MEEMKEITILAVYLFILLLTAARFLPGGKGKGRVMRRFRVGRAMTIGTRQVQEDNYGICQGPDAFMAVLADGMGRDYGGKVSSRIAVETVKDMFSCYQSSENPAYFFRRAFHAANAAILDELDDGRGGASVGAVLIRDGFLYYAVAGSVKVAVCRKGELVPLSTGHTVGMLAEGRFMEGSITRQQALDLLGDRRLYNYVGQDGFEEIEFFDTPVRLKERDTVVLMSDGLYEGVDWKTIEELLAGRGKCQQKAYDIIEAVNTGIQKEKDNASIVLVEGFL